MMNAFYNVFFSCLRQFQTNFQEMLALLLLFFLVLIMNNETIFIKILSPAGFRVSICLIMAYDFNICKTVPADITAGTEVILRAPAISNQMRNDIIF